MRQRDPESVTAGFGMSETGGPTTQSGILYQNSIAALFLGRLCDAAQRPDRERVIGVRVEAPGHVDDIVVTFADDHREFIHVKESVRPGQDPWRKLWSDFDAQFRRADFRRGEDRLVLYVGEMREEHRVLREVCLRASGSASYGEWQDTQSEDQKALVSKIVALFTGSALDGPAVLAIFSHVRVESWSLSEIERDKTPYWMPPTCEGRVPVELFRLLRDRVGGEARRRGTFTAPGLRADLASEGYRLAEPPDIATLREAVTGCGALLRHHKHTIAHTGRHVPAGVVGEILAWARSPPSTAASPSSSIRRGWARVSSCVTP